MIGHIEFIISLGVTVFSAGVVFATLKNEVKHLSRQFEEYKSRTGDSTKERVDVQVAIVKLETSVDVLVGKVDELVKDVKELNKR